MLFLLLAGIFTLKGQEAKPFAAAERVELFTDRTLYIAGEQIFLSVFLQSGTGANLSDLSRVLYCELITPDGEKIIGNKYFINGFYAFGYIAIPEDITTGIYYLRAYTKVMRNSGPSYYHYTMLKIVNPRRSEVRAVTDQNYLSESISGEELQEKPEDLLLISADKSQYAPTDTVHISINRPDSIQFSWKGLSLAVVPEYSISENKVTLSENGQYEKRVFYYPETRGLSITGNLTDNTTGNPLPRNRVNLSIIGRGRDFMAMQTDSSGRFFFSLPDYIGFRDLFLCTENSITSDPKIQVDNDYCTIPFHIPSIIFTLTQQEREATFKMAVNVQLGSYFKDDSIADAGNNQREDRAFYGKPNEILYFDNYVRLPSLEEYFNEVLTLAKVRMRQGKKYFKVLGSQTGLTDLEPLTLVDLVAIDNPSMVLAISPINISRIEVVNQLYVKGDQTYGGIINIISKRGDFAGIDLPSSGVFINYGFLADSSHYRGIYPPMQHSPDTRNTLYWEPKFELNKSNTTKVTFTTSDTPGKYLIILNGINSKGITIRQTSTIEVIKKQMSQAIK